MYFISKHFSDKLILSYSTYFSDLKTYYDFVYGMEYIWQIHMQISARLSEDFCKRKKLRKGSSWTLLPLISLKC